MKKPSFQRVESKDFQLTDCPTLSPISPYQDPKAALKAAARRIDDVQQRLHAEARQSLLVIFQAMDAGGKDSTIRAVFRRVNPAGCRVHSYQAPSLEERSHDFLWRCVRDLPAAGQIGIFNRSYYEEVLTVRVHPQWLKAQGPVAGREPAAVWASRFASIRHFEQHLSENRTRVIKFWLHVSPEEQGRRLLDRLDTPDKQWKFSPSDLEARAQWPTYQAAAEAMIRETATPTAPWFVIPADDKPVMRATVASILAETLEAMNPAQPRLDDDIASRLSDYRQALRGRGKDQ